MYLPTVIFLAPAAVCVLSWAGAGLAVPRGLLAGELLLDGLTRIAFGSVAVSLLVLAIGRAGLLDRPLVVGLTLAGAAVGLFTLPPLVRAARSVRVQMKTASVLGGATALALAIDLVASTAPVSSADALKYHLALPRLWLQQGSIGDPFWRWEGFNPSGIEMLYTQGLALAGGSAAAPLHAFFAVLCALAIFGLGRELGGSALAGAVASFLFVQQGIVSWEATSAFIELGLTFYLALAVWHAVRWARAPGHGAAAWTGFLAGAAAGTKYLGLTAALVAGGAWALAALGRRRTTDVAVASGAALVAGGWWYLKNAIATGNPLYPFLLGGKWLTPFASQVIHAGLSAYGVGGGVFRLTILPLDLLAHGQAFDRGAYVGSGIFVFGALTVVTRRTRATALCLAGVIVFVVAWHLQSPQARFLLPALAVLAALGGAAAAPWLHAGGRRRGAVLAVLSCAAAVWLVSTGALTRQLLPVTVGLESRTAALERLTGTYDALLAARGRAGAGTVGLVGYPFTFNFPGRAVTVDVPEFTPFLPRTAFVARLRSLGVRSLLVGGGLGALGPIRGCLTQEETFHARFVTSRSLGQSTPYDLVLYSLVGCER